MAEKFIAGSSPRQNRLLTLRARLFAGFFVMAGVSVLIIAVFFQLSATANRNSRRAAELARTAALIGKLEHAVAEASVPPRDFAITGAAYQSRLWARRVQVWQRLWEKARVKALVGGAGTKTGLGATARRLAALQQTQAQLFAVKSSADKARIMLAVDKLEQSLNREFDRMAGLMAAKSDRLLAQAQAAQDRTVYLSWLAVALIVAIALALNLAANVTLVQPLKELESGLRG